MSCKITSSFECFGTMWTFHFSFITIIRCCNNCPRGDCPRWQLSKGLLSKLTVVQGYFCPRRLFSKEDFCPRWQLSKETFVQGDRYMHFCPRRFLNNHMNFFNGLLCISGHSIYILLLIWNFSWEIHGLVLISGRKGVNDSKKKCVYYPFNEILCTFLFWLGKK